MLAESTAVYREEKLSEKMFLVEPKKIIRKDPNALTLDTARWSLDGENFSAPLPVMEIEEKVAKSKYTKIFIRYEFTAEFVPSDLRIAVERSAKNIQVNGKHCDFSSEWYIDKSIGVIPIADCAKMGVNTVELFFETSPENILTPEALDAENEIARNLFSYGLEIENIYVLGSFSVKVNNFTLNKNVLYVEDGIFAIIQRKENRTRIFNASGVVVLSGANSYKNKIP